MFWQNASTTDETYETVFEPQRGFTPTVKVISAPSNTHDKIFPKVWTNSENLVKITSPELKAKSAVSSIANVEPPSTEPSTAKFFKILEYTQLTVRQISSGSSQNRSIGTGSTHVPRASIQNQRARASTKKKTTIKWIRIHCWWSLYKRHDRELALQLRPWTALASVESTSKKISQMNLGRATTK